MLKANSSDKAFLKLHASNTPQHIAALSELEGDLSLMELIHAGKNLPEIFPNLNCYVSESGLIPENNFRLADHFEEITDSARCYADIIGEELRKPFCPNKAQWIFTLVNSANGKFLMLKLHHAFTDGLGALQLLYELCREKPRPTLPSFNASQKSKSFLSLIVKQLLPFRSSSLNGVNTDSRTINLTQFPLDGFTTLKRELGASMQEILLGTVSSWISDYTLKNGERLKKVRALIPVSIRTERDRYSFGNRLLGASVELPTGYVPFETTLGKIKTTIAKMKEDGSFMTYARLAEKVNNFPPAVTSGILNTQAKANNFICTTLFGPAKTLTVGSATIKGIYPLAAPMKGHGLSIGFLTYRKTLCVAVVSDKGIVKNTEDFRKSLYKVLRDIGCIK